ncbi:hypothetical protein ACVW00_001338 [Marmoricola sp. URHA0025 HA25]
MEIERVQRWVMTALMMTTAVIFATGLSLLAAQADRAGAEPGLLTIAAVVGVLAVAAARVIHQKSVLTPLLLLGVLPAAIVGYFVLGR